MKNRIEEEGGVRAWVGACAAGKNWHYPSIRFGSLLLGRRRLPIPLWEFTVLPDGKIFFPRPPNPAQSKESKGSNFVVLRSGAIVLHA